MPVTGDLVGAGRGERADHLRDVGQRGEGGHHPGRPVLDRAAVMGPVVVITTWVGLPFWAGEGPVEDLLDRLGAAGEVVGEVAAGGLGHHVGADQRHQPEDQHPPPVVVAPAGDAGQPALLGRLRLGSLHRHPGGGQCGRGHGPRRLLAGGGPGGPRRRHAHDGLVQGGAAMGSLEHGVSVGRRCRRRMPPTSSPRRPGWRPCPRWAG